MNVLTFAATTSRESLNRRLLDYAARLLEEGPGGIAVEMIDLNEYETPIFSIDREAEHGIPDRAHDFFARIGAADALLISYAEHNGAYTAAYKNLFDWASRIDRRLYQDKPTVMLSTSPGRNGGANVLRTAVDSAPLFGSEVLASLAVPSFNQSFDSAAGALLDAHLDEQFRATVAVLSARATTG
jgi:NAD(P)H-dependent FMN reductase